METFLRYQKLLRGVTLPWERFLLEGIDIYSYEVKEVIEWSIDPQRHHVRLLLKLLHTYVEYDCTTTGGNSSECSGIMFLTTERDLFYKLAVNHEMFPTLSDLALIQVKKNNHKKQEKENLPPLLAQYSSLLEEACASKERPKKECIVEMVAKHVYWQAKTQPGKEGGDRGSGQRQW